MVYGLLSSKNVDTHIYSSSIQIITHTEYMGVFISYILRSIIALHLLSLSSSSLIEEEHHFWHYSAVTVCILLATYQFINNAPFLSPLLMACITRVLRSWNFSGIKWNEIIQEKQKSGEPLDWRWMSISQMVIENPQLLQGIAIISAICVIFFNIPALAKCISYPRRIVEYMISLATITNVILYKIRPQVLPYPFGSIYFLYLLHVVLLGLAMVHLKKYKWLETRTYIAHRILSVFVSMWLLLERISNYGAIALILLQLLLLFRTYWTHQSDLLARWQKRKRIYSLSKSDWWIISHILGMSAYYSLGRSISIATIDFGGVYQGLQEYNPTLIAALIFLLQYLPRSIFVLAAIYICSSIQQNQDNLLSRCTESTWLFENLFVEFGLLRTPRMLMGSAMLLGMKDHLFIWSVFCPKYLYELGDTAFSLFASAIIIAFAALSAFYRKKKAKVA